MILSCRGRDIPRHQLVRLNPRQDRDRIRQENHPPVPPTLGSRLVGVLSHRPLSHPGVPFAQLIASVCFALTTEFRVHIVRRPPQSCAHHLRQVVAVEARFQNPFVTRGLVSI